MTFIEYKTKAQMFDAVATRIAAELSTSLSRSGKASLAVPGGSTPGPIFDALSTAKLDWKNVTVLLGDERWVPLESERSNTGLVKRRLLQDQAKHANYQPLYDGSDTALSGAENISESVEDILPLSVAVLGMGTDMHTASIFPNAPERAAAQAEDAPAVLAITPGDGLEDRVTLSARALLTAADIHLVIIGADKRDALEAAKSSDFSIAPIAQFLPNANVHWAPE